MSTRKGNVVFMDDLLEEAKAHAAQVVREIRTDYSEDKSIKLLRLLAPLLSDLTSLGES